ncbi:hypothetical protein TCAL_16630 [Tigriopus californicus]|uniref:Uncharacterized protein n=1 Tax=Tigriopus californicus TaxID=6832 RepID=A0A553NFV7_TIGCA|nr:hypothetical protein TCAL_16630 [Tigriopus californicus]
MIGSQRSAVILLVCLVGLLIDVTRTQGVQRVEKSVISYQGTDFLLHDGCPEPQCDQSQGECQRTINMVRALYSHCSQSEDGQHVGCVSDLIGPKQTITLPVYASICSAMCYESDPKNLERVHRCPTRGFRVHDPSLQSLF